jgi:hypothetical protein
MIHKDLPEGRTGVYVYQRERERALRAAKLNCNNYLFLCFGLLTTVNVLKHLCIFVSLLDCW